MQINQQCKIIYNRGYRLYSIVVENNQVSTKVVRNPNTYSKLMDRINGKLLYENPLGPIQPTIKAPKAGLSKPKINEILNAARTAANANKQIHGAIDKSDVEFDIDAANIYNAFATLPADQKEFIDNYNKVNSANNYYGKGGYLFNYNKVGKSDFEFTIGGLYLRENHLGRVIVDQAALNHQWTVYDDGRVQNRTTKNFMDIGFIGGGVAEIACKRFINPNDEKIKQWDFRKADDTLLNDPIVNYSEEFLLKFLNILPNHAIIKVANNYAYILMNLTWQVNRFYIKSLITALGKNFPDYQRCIKKGIDYHIGSIYGFHITLDRNFIADIQPHVNKVVTIKIPPIGQHPFKIVDAQVNTSITVLNPGLIENKLGYQLVIPFRSQDPLSTLYRAQAQCWSILEVDLLNPPSLNIKCPPPHKCHVTLSQFVSVQ